MALPQSAEPREDGRLPIRHGIPAIAVPGELQVLYVELGPRGWRRVLELVKEARARPGGSKIGLEIGIEPKRDDHRRRIHLRITPPVETYHNGE